jgi:HJR/Mrr/RecB family endonuclease
MEKRPVGSISLCLAGDLTHVDLLTGPEFEKFVGKVFEQKGYSVEYHGGPTEAGGDLVCWEGATDRVHAILVQVKRERSLTGTQAIGQILRKENWFRHNYPTATYEKWVVTSSRFSAQAKKEAISSRIVLVDRVDLQLWINSDTRKPQA